jgi:ketosteroid isomerase-like protein
MCFCLTRLIQSSTPVWKRCENAPSSGSPHGLYEVRNLAVTAGDEVAFCHSINRVSGVKVDGTKIDMKGRATVGFRKIDGNWTAIHEHSSVPFDMDSGVVSFKAEL